MYLFIFAFKSSISPRLQSMLVGKMFVVVLVVLFVVLLLEVLVELLCWLMQVLVVVAMMTCLQGEVPVKIIQ